MVQCEKTGTWGGGTTTLAGSMVSVTSQTSKASGNGFSNHIVWQ